jgi:HK97 gp10 family phage protein
VSVEIRVSDNIAQAIQQIEHGADLFIEALADHVVDEFRSNVHMVTGAMKASASVVTAHGSDYAENVARAAALNPKAEFAPEEHVQPGEAVVQVPVGYAAFEEFGTSQRAAHPALVPAMETVAARAEAIAREVFDLQ